MRRGVVPLQDKRRLLSFIVVGGGPTGVEVAAELFDLICEDLTKYYPDLRQFACVKLVELQVGCLCRAGIIQVACWGMLSHPLMSSFPGGSLKKQKQFLTA